MGLAMLWVNACGEGDKTIIVITGGAAGVPGASGGSGGAASGGVGSGGDSMVAGASGSANGGNGSGGVAGASAGGDGNAGTMTTGGSGGSDAAGSTNGGSAGSTNGGNGGSAGSSGSGSGGAAGKGGSAGSGGSGGVPPICMDSITVNQTACSGPCRENTCGIQRLGVRDCSCQGAGAQYPGTYACTSCDYTINIGNPIIDPPAGAMVGCDSDDATMEDRLDCGISVENGYRCQSLDNATRMCACWNDFWDCGSKPAFWASVCPGSIDSGVTLCSASCMGSRCGIHNVGVRDCPCPSGTYVCTACDYDPAMSHPLVQEPAGPLPNCDSADILMEDRFDCGVEIANAYRCQSIDDTNRLCACWNGVWDCASKPAFWAN